jgi:hypothetical protein
MRQIVSVIGLFTLAALFLDTGAAQAGRTPVLRTAAQRSPGSRADISVPYLTSGRSPFVAVGVEPRIYASPIVDDPRHPQSKPVFNLIFYGATQAFGSQENGATPRPR